VLSVFSVILPSAPGLWASMKSCGSPSSSASVAVMVFCPFGMFALNSLPSLES